MGSNWYTDCASTSKVQRSTSLLSCLHGQVGVIAEGNLIANIDVVTSDKCGLLLCGRWGYRIGHTRMVEAGREKEEAKRYSSVGIKIEGVLFKSCPHGSELSG